MVRVAADENFNTQIVTGVVRRLQAVDIVRVQDAGLARADDPTVLAWAAADGRILLTHDVNTIAAFAYERISQGLSMPGVFAVSLDANRVFLAAHLMAAEELSGLVCEVTTCLPLHAAL